MEERVLLTVYPVTETLDGTTPGTLRWAITQVNQGTGGDTIAFAIPGSGVRTIQLSSALPTITESVIIDGSTQPNYLGTPLIQLDGSGAGVGVAGLSVTAGSTTIVGLSIVGFQGDAIRLLGAGRNAVYGNYLGVGADGSTVGSNGGHGIVLAGDDNAVGGVLPNQGNVISANGGYGIMIDGGSTNVVQGNLVGVDASGTLKRGNNAGGILVKNGRDNRIGGVTLPAGNVISGNGAHGIETFGATDGLLVQGNVIGTDRSRSLDLGNRIDGVHLFSSNNTVGGTVPGAGNTIAYNGIRGLGVGAGVALVLNVVNNAILSNAIFANVGLGIDLGGSGNRSQQPPRLDAASTDATSTSVSGVLNGGRPNSTYLIQFFANTTGDPLGFGEGEVCIGAVQVGSDASGNAVFNAGLPVGVGPGALISATATDAAGNTSQFARNITLKGTADLGVALTASPAAASVGDTITFTVVATNYGPTAAGWTSATVMLPAGVVVVSAQTADGVPGVPGPNSITFHFSGLRVGESATATIVVQTSVATGTKAIASASVRSEDGDPNPSNNVGTTTVTLSPVVDLAIAVQAPTGPLAAGRTLTYLVTLTNRGPSKATGVVLSDVLPAHVTLISASASRGTTSIQGDVITTSIPELGSGAAPVVLTIVVALDPGADVSSIANTASATAVELDANSTDNSATATTQVTRSADLQVQLLAGPTPVLKGQPLTYTVRLTNLGPSTATAVVLTNVLPAGAVFVSAVDDVDGTPTFANGVVTDLLGALAPGSMVVLTILVAAPGSAAASSLTNVASVASAVSDPDHSNDSATLTTALNPAADLSVVVTADAASVGVGRPLTYTVTVTNRGPSIATGVTLVDLLPADVAVSSISVSQGTATRTDERVTAALGSLAPDATATLTIVIDAPNDGRSSLLNTALVASEIADPLDANNQATVTTDVTPRTELAVNITPPVGPLVVGRPVSYVVTVTNRGPSLATGVRLDELLPVGATFVSAADDRGTALTPVDGRLNVALGELAAGDSATVTIVVAVATPGPFATTATVGGDEADDDPSNNAATFTSAVVAAADLTLNVATERAAATIGDSLTYLLTVTNQGPSRATGVVFHRVLPLGAAVVSITTSQGTVVVEGGGLTAQLGDLAVGASATLKIVVAPSVVGPATSLDTVTAQELDLNPADNAALSTLNVLDRPGALEFAAGDVVVNEDAGTATIVVTRLGGRRGQVTVDYYTVMGGTAVPGLDFVPVSGRLIFNDGESTRWFTVPILANPHSQQDRTVRLILSDPQGGAELGSRVAATLTIHDLDPDFTGPRVEEVRMLGAATSIDALQLFFSEPLDPATAFSPSSYRLFDAGPDGRYGTTDDRPIALLAPAYDAAAGIVSLKPEAPLAANRFYYVQAAGLRDRAGNLLEGGPGALAPHEFGAYVIRGTNLRYYDSRQTLVTIGLTGGGVLDLTRRANGEGDRLQVLRPVPGRSVLNGRVRGGAKATSYRSIIGLGAFGEVRVAMNSPSFLVDNLPFNRRSTSPPAVDTVYGPVRIAGRPAGPRPRRWKR